MVIRFHPHALDRIVLRGITEHEVEATLEEGEEFQVRFGLNGFRRNFSFDDTWFGRYYRTKQVEPYAVREGDGRLAGYHSHYTLSLSSWRG